VGIRRKKHPTSLVTDRAAEYVGCSAKFLEADRLLVKAGKPGRGPAFWMLGSEYRYEVADLDAWKAANRFDPANPPPRRHRLLTAST
jgi:hypothetical protein